MKYLIIVLFTLLSACGGSDSSNSAPAITVDQMNQAISQAVSAATHADAQQVASLQTELNKFKLIGHPSMKTSNVESFAEMGEPIVDNATTVSGQFGPCADMGVQDGFDSEVSDALSATSKAFQTCTGYHVEYMAMGGAIKAANRIYFDGPNCTGNLIEWEAGGAGFDTETLKDGVVFINPADNTTVLMVQAGQTPTPILIQSAIVVGNPGCESDVETQLMYPVIPNNTQITGVPNSSIGNFTTGSP